MYRSFKNLNKNTNLNLYTFLVYHKNLDLSSKGGNMVIQITNRKQYKDNISRICDREDICTAIEELVERISNTDFENKDKFIEDLNGWKFDVDAEIQYYENQNLEFMEKWEVM
jgi:hypothetical protein